jgi:hypothetical protein
MIHFNLQLLSLQLNLHSTGFIIHQVTGLFLFSSSLICFSLNLSALLTTKELKLECNQLLHKIHLYI